MPVSQPITLDPTQLEEEFVQEAIGWMEGKSTEELQEIISQAQDQPDTYAPEIVEAVQRILAKREQLPYTETKGQKIQEDQQRLEQKVQVKGLNGKTQDFQSHGELRQAILDGNIPKETLIREGQTLGEKMGIQGTSSEITWEPVEAYARSYFTLAPLYIPLQYFTTMGMLFGILIASFGIFQPFVFPALSFENMPQEFKGVSYVLPGFVFLSLRSWLLTGKIKKHEILIGGDTYLFYLGLAILGFVGYGLEPVKLDHVTAFVHELVIAHSWALAFFFNGLVFGAPVGAIIGTLTGYIWSTFHPKAPDAESEGSWLWDYGLIYPAMFMVVTWPTMHQWVFPWILSVLPISPIQNL